MSDLFYLYLSGMVLFLPAILKASAPAPFAVKIVGNLTLCILWPLLIAYIPVAMWRKRGEG